MVALFSLSALVSQMATVQVSVSATCPVWLDPPRMRDKQTALLVLLRATCECLAEADIPCWITGGTALGALRHGGFVPHDDDVDIECFQADADRIDQAISAHPHLRFQKGGAWKGQWPIVTSGLESTNLVVDIFLREEVLDEGDQYFPRMNEIYPMRTYSFHGVGLPGPGQPSAWMSRLYGEDWASSVRVWNHEFNWERSLAHDPERVNMTLDAYTAYVADLGYLPPEAPTLDARDALDFILMPGGLVSRVNAAAKAVEIELVVRRNREEANAKFLLAEQRQAARAAIGAED